MSVRLTHSGGRQFARTGWVLAVAALMSWPAVGRTQPATTPLVAPLPANLDPAVMPAVATGVSDSGIQQAGCASCGTGGGAFEGPGVFGFSKHDGIPSGIDGFGCSTCGGGSGGCGENGCVPGRQPCCTCEGHGRLGRIFCAVHNAMCCPDPCYEPHWNCGANAALFVDPVRPITQTRLRWDSGRDYLYPDRGEYFWNAIQTNGRGPAKRERSINYNELRYYQEAGTDKFTLFVETPYRNLNGDANGGFGGFSDLLIGTRTLLLDSELIQTTFQLTTSVPIGRTANGLGNGHVNMEPSILWSIKMYADSYWQGSLGYWIPISGTPTFAAGVFKWRNAWNQLIARPLPDVALFGTIEGIGYTFTSGGYTDPDTGMRQKANDFTAFTVGPGFRLCICERFDFGVGLQFAVTNPHMEETLLRSEIRFRF